MKVLCPDFVDDRHDGCDHSRICQVPCSGYFHAMFIQLQKSDSIRKTMQHGVFAQIASLEGGFRRHWHSCGLGVLH
jgi:hypothetical protein